MKTSKLLSSIALALPLVANAGGTHSIDLICCSYHTDRTTEYNEVNPGIIYRYSPEASTTYYFAGGYKNSFSNISLMAGAGKEFEIAKYLTAGFGGGLVTGYSSDIVNRPIMPIGFGTVTVFGRVTGMVMPTPGGRVYGLTVKVGEW